MSILLQSDIKTTVLCHFYLKKMSVNSGSALAQVRFAESDPVGVSYLLMRQGLEFEPTCDTPTPRSASFPLMAAAAKLALGFAFRSDSLAESPANRVQSKRLLIVA